MKKRKRSELEQAIGRMLDLELLLEMAVNYYSLEGDWEMVIAEMKADYCSELTSLSWSECQQMLTIFAKENIRPEDGEDLKATLREHGLLKARTIRVQ